jgi:hypothetical protein
MLHFVLGQLAKRYSHFLHLALLASRQHAGSARTDVCDELLPDFPNYVADTPTSSGLIN